MRYRTRHKPVEQELGAQATLSPVINDLTPPDELVVFEDPDRPHYSEEPVAFVNCAFRGRVDGGLSSNARRTSGKPGGNNFAVLASANFILDSFTQCYRYDANEVTYEVDVPVQGIRYNVALFFCESRENMLAIGRNVMNVEVEGVEGDNYVKKDLDVFAEVGGFQAFVLTFSGLKVATKIQIRVRRGSEASIPFLNGFHISEKMKERQKVISDSIIAVIECGNDGVQVECCLLISLATGKITSVIGSIRHVLRLVT